MAGSPDSPIHLQGASRMTGGIFRGRALGNNYNMADSMDFDHRRSKVVGKVHVYNTHGNPDDLEPYLSLKHEVTQTLAPVLKKLGNQYSPVKSML
jgi:hypothetical protein